MLTTLIGAFCGAMNGREGQQGDAAFSPQVFLQNRFRAVCAAMAVMGVCGELADERRMKNGTGNATFRMDLIDAVFNLNEEQFKEKIHYEIYKR